MGIDVGGTHTDAVMLDKIRVLVTAKLVTDPEGIMTSLLSATRSILRSGPD